MAVPTLIDYSIGIDNSSQGICADTFTATAGDLIVVVGSGYEMNWTTYVPADTQTNTYTAQCFVATGTTRIRLWTAVAQSSGSLIVTLDAFASGNSIAGFIGQFRGQDASFVNQTGTTANAASSTTFSVDLPDTTVADCLVLGLFGLNGSTVTFTEGSGWTSLGITSLGDPGLAGCYRAAATAGAYDPNGTVSSANAYSGVAIAIAGAASGAAKPALMNSMLRRRRFG